MRRRQPSGMLAPRSATAVVFLLVFLAHLSQHSSCAGDRSRADAFIGYIEKEHGAVAAGFCEDKESGCGQWKDQHECLLNPNFMRETCAKSCSSCKGHELRGKIRGSITPEDSKEFAAFYPAVAKMPVSESSFRYDPSLGDLEQIGDGMRTRPWPMLSSLGIGTYLGNEDDTIDEQVVSAIVKSVAHGCNVIDTARNYRNGRGEDSVRRAVDMLTRNGVRRSSLFISTKAGFLPEALSKQLLAAGKVEQGDVVGTHCMHPACLEASLQQSLAALNLETVDLLYVHNPAELQLAPLGKERFFARLSAAFQALEKLRDAGKIRSYGLATWNCFRVAPEDPGYLSLQEVVDLAVKISGKQHGFRYVQLPINVAMREAWQQPWQALAPRPAAPGAAGTPQWLPLTAAAARLGVGVMASGPLSEAALLKDTNTMAKLQAVAEIAGDSAASSSAAAAALQIARSTPYVITAIVGHKNPRHVSDNLRVLGAQLLDRQMFREIMSDL